MERAPRALVRLLLLLLLLRRRRRRLLLLLLVVVVVVVVILSGSVCVCVCARARVRVCVCSCGRACGRVRVWGAGLGRQGICGEKGAGQWATLHWIRMARARLRGA